MRINSESPQISERKEEMDEAHEEQSAPSKIVRKKRKEESSRILSVGNSDDMPIPIPVHVISPPSNDIPHGVGFSQEMTHVTKEEEQHIPNKKHKKSHKQISKQPRQSQGGLLTVEIPQPVNGTLSPRNIMSPIGIEESMESEASVASKKRTSSPGKKKRVKHKKRRKDQFGTRIKSGQTKHKISFADELEH